jgi:GNAT superfamily N-acetyltransferase
MSKLLAKESIYDIDLYLRKAEPADVNFITSSWLDSYRYSVISKPVRTTEFYHYEHQMLESIIPKSTVVVLCPATDPGHIWAWAVYEKLEGVLVLHYVLTKKEFKRRGLAKKLVTKILEIEQPKAVAYTYTTRDAYSIISSHQEELGEWRYNPYVRYLYHLHINAAGTTR